MINRLFWCNTCKHQGAESFLCFHPNYIGKDGDGVSLTVMEKEFVKRMGCASHSLREYNPNWGKYIFIGEIEAIRKFTSDKSVNNILDVVSKREAHELKMVNK